MLETKESFDDSTRIYNGLANLLFLMKDCKPKDRSDMDRIYALAISDLEKIIGYWLGLVLLKRGNLEWRY